MQTLAVRNEFARIYTFYFLRQRTRTTIMLAKRMNEHAFVRAGGDDIKKHQLSRRTKCIVFAADLMRDGVTLIEALVTHACNAP